jgi:hypothetical protein
MPESRLNMTPAAWRKTVGQDLPSLIQMGEKPKRFWALFSNPRIVTPRRLTVEEAVRDRDELLAVRKAEGPDAMSRAAVAMKNAAPVKALEDKAPQEVVPGWADVRDAAVHCDLQKPDEAQASRLQNVLSRPELELIQMPAEEMQTVVSQLNEEYGKRFSEAVQWLRDSWACIPEAKRKRSLTAAPAPAKKRSRRKA